MEPRISVIIPVLNDPQGLTKCLTAVGTSHAPPHETIVVDDGSTGDLQSLTDTFGARLIRIGTGPRGPAHARNAGAALATGDIILFVDADVVVRTDTLARVARTFATHTGVSAVFGSYDDEPVTPDFVSQFKNLFHHFVHQQAKSDAQTFWSGCGAVRRNVFIASGGFDDTRYPRPSIEDIELGYRLRSAGHEIMLNNEIQVKHLKRWTLRGLIRTDIFDRGVPWTTLILERRRLPNDLNLQVLQRLSAMLAGSMLLYLAWVAFFHDVVSFPIVAPLLAGAGLIVALNHRLYLFLARKRGVTFAFASLPMHLLYYSCSLVALGLGCVVFLTRTRGNRVTAGAP